MGSMELMGSGIEISTVSKLDADINFYYFMIDWMQFNGSNGCSHITWLFTQELTQLEKE